jgi:hypothetical protein
VTTAASKKIDRADFFTSSRHAEATALVRYLKSLVFSCSRMRFVFCGAHSLRGGITFAHVCAVFRVSVKSRSAEMVDFGF